MATLVRSDRYYSLRRCLFIDCPHHRSSIIPAHIPSLSFSPSFVSTLIFNCVVFDFQDFAWKSSFCHSLCVRPSSDRGTGDHAARAEMWWDVTTATVLRRSPANTEETSGCETMGGRWHSDNGKWILCAVRSVFHLCSLCSSWSQSRYVQLELLLQAITLL